MRSCPDCRRPLRNERREIAPGIFARVDVCPRCTVVSPAKADERMLRALFRRKAFRAGGSLAVRIPKELANTLGLREGSPLAFKLNQRGLNIEPLD